MASPSPFTPDAHTQQFITGPWSYQNTAYGPDTLVLLNPTNSLSVAFATTSRYCQIREPNGDARVRRLLSHIQGQPVKWIMINQCSDANGVFARICFMNNLPEYECNTYRVYDLRF